MRALAQDLRYAIRHLRKSPGFVVVAVATLAIGIGANTAVFSLVRGVVLRPPQYESPERLGRVWLSTPDGDPYGPLNPADLVDLRDAGSIEGLAFGTETTRTLTGLDQPHSLSVGLVSANYFSVLGVAPDEGRFFRHDEDGGGSTPVAVVSYGAWRTLLGGGSTDDPRTLTLDGVGYELVGVAAPGFEDPITGTQPDIWVPYVVDPENRGGHFMKAMARLAPGADLSRGTADLGRLWGVLAADYSFKQGRAITLEPLQRAMTGAAREPLVILLGAVAFVLLIACTNLAGLGLTRGVSRRRELAIRSALGAGSRRIARQLLLESLVVAALGGAAGLAIAGWTLGAATAVLPADLPRASQIRIDGWVLAFTFGVTLVTGVLFGLLPALRSRRIDVVPALKWGGGRAVTGGGGTRLRSVLVVVQVALSIVLLVGSGLLVRAVMSLEAVDPGFEAERVLAFRVATPSADYPDLASSHAFFDLLFERIESLPGVVAVGGAQVMPLRGGASCAGFSLSDGIARPDACAEERIVRGDYFGALGIRLVEGRTFDERDLPSSEPVVVVNQAAVRAYWRGLDPIGEGFHWGVPDGEDPWRTVIGVVEDVRHFGLDEEARPEIYMPHAQQSFSRRFEVAVRTTGDPPALVGLIRREVREIDPDIPLVNPEPLASALSREVAPARFNAGMVGVFAALAALLAGLGLYGLLAFTVRERTREIGIRLALGAPAGSVLGHIVGAGVRLTLLGVGAGLAAALALTRLLAGILHGVSPSDPIVYGGVAAALVATAIVASWVPARRAARVDPIIALRAE